MMVLVVLLGRLGLLRLRLADLLVLSLLELLLLLVVLLLLLLKLLLLVLLELLLALFVGALLLQPLAFLDLALFELLALSVLFLAEIIELLLLPLFNLRIDGWPRGRRTIIKGTVIVWTVGISGRVCIGVAVVIALIAASAGIHVCRAVGSMGRLVEIAGRLVRPIRIAIWRIAAIGALRRQSSRPRLLRNANIAARRVVLADL